MLNIFKGPLTDLTSIRKASYILLWLGDESQERYQHWPEALKDACPIENIWSNMYKAVGHTVSPLVYILQFLEATQQPCEPVDDVILRCRRLASRCQYSNSDDAIIDTLLRGGRSMVAQINRSVATQLPSINPC